MKDKIIVLLIFFGITTYLHGQQFNVSQHEYFVCHGNPVQLNSHVTYIDTLTTVNFDDGMMPVGWIVSAPVDFSNPCGIPPNGSGLYCWVGNQSNFPRFIISAPIQVTDSSVISFDMKYSVQAVNSPCEGPDEPTEGVHFQYSSVGNSGPWTELNYWNPNGGYDPNLTMWNNYSFQFNIDSVIWLRWYQHLTSGIEYDHWGIDNVMTGLQGSLLPHSSVVWQNNQGFYYEGETPPPYYPDSSGWIYVSFSCAAGTLTDSVHITVFDTEHILFSGLPDTLCTNSTPIYFSVTPPGGIVSGSGVTGNYFDPQGLSGYTDIIYTYSVTEGSIQTGPIQVFYDDFSTDMGWMGYGAGGWTRGPAVGGGGDPNIDHTATNDNYIIGTYLGANYPNNMTQTYWLTSPIINCSNMNSCTVEFWSYSGCESVTYDHLYFGISTNAGGNWTNIYSNSGYLMETNWNNYNFQIPQASDCNSFMVRFGLGPTDGTSSFAGWNIDDFVINCNGPLVIQDTICTITAVQNVYVDCCTNIDERSQKQKTVYPFPQPSNDFVIIPIQKMLTPDHMAICNSLGDILFEIELKSYEKQIRFGTNNLPTGIYYALIKKNGTILQSQKFIVNKNQ